MYRQYLESIAGISIYPIISLIIFFLFFTVLISYLIKADKQHLDMLSHLPLQKNDSNTDQYTV